MRAGAAAALRAMAARAGAAAVARAATESSVLPCEVRAATAVPAACASRSKTINGDPTAILSPGVPVTASTRPLTGAGTSTEALSVMTSTIA